MRRKQAKGLTLTEVVMSASLLAIAVVPILRALSHTHYTGGVIDRRTQSLILAQAKMDEVKARGVYDFDQSDSTFSGNNQSLGNGYYANVRFVRHGHDDLKRLEVQVGRDLDGNNVLGSDEVEVELKTLVARRWP